MSTFGELKCEVCGVSGSVVPMHRANEKGVAARWRCEPCLGKPIESEVLAVTDYFQTQNMGDEPMTPELEAWVRAQRKRA